MKLRSRKKLVLGILLFFISFISASRLPVVGDDNFTWGNVLDDYLMTLSGENATLLNQTMVNGTNIYSNAINTTQIFDSTITDVDINDSTNLTLGQKITFALGEVIDNIADGWIKITGNVNMSGNNASDVLKINFDNKGCSDSSTEGTICWNPDDKTMNIVTGLGNVIQVGQETTLIGKNVDSVTLLNGQIITLVGSSGDKGIIKRADASNSSLSSRLAIVTIDSCIVNADCPVTTYGRVRGLNTASWTAGTLLYLSADGSGNLTSTPPSFPNYRVLIGAVIRSHATDGIVLVSPQVDYTTEITFHSIDIIHNLTAADSVIAGKYFSEGRVGINATGTSCTITRITNGIITGATCS